MKQTSKLKKVVATMLLATMTVTGIGTIGVEAAESSTKRGHEASYKYYNSNWSDNFKLGYEKGKEDGAEVYETYGENSLYKINSFIKFHRSHTGGDGQFEAGYASGFFEGYTERRK